MSKKLLQAAAGAAAGEALYVEDVFSTYLYQGASASKTITNDIDLSGEGGLIWTKRRDGTARTHILVDTERGAGKVLNTDGTYAEYTMTNMPSSFNSDGYTIGTTDAGVNDSSYNYASWTFRKAEKFFDVVTYTGNGANNRQVAHNLGSIPHFILVKSLGFSASWYALHYDGSSWTSLILNSTAAGSTASGAVWGDGTNFVAPTSTDFTVASFGSVNADTYGFVAYLFASDAGGFGDDENIIKCGSYTGTGAAGLEVDLGFEPQFLIVKNASAVENWGMFDLMRDGALYPNTSGSEVGGGFYFNHSEATGYFKPLATGFRCDGNNGAWNGSGATHIYIAIRRPMKTPESGTEVYAPVTNTGTGSAANITTNFPVDLTIVRDRNNTDDDRNFVWDRLRGGSQRLTTQNTGAEQSATHVEFDYQDKIVTAGTSTWFSGASYIFWNFKRATGFFDVVCYTGTGVARTVAHNLGVAPELMIFKVRDRAGSSWVGYHKDLGNEGIFSLDSYAALSGVTSAFNSTTPTSSVFTVGAASNFNGNTDNLIAYLFATLAGVSKVGSYTGTGSNVDVNCGFSAGARFILIKRTDSTGDWYVWDSERGIVAGNDPYLLLNSTAAEVTSTDYIDPLSSGFTVTSSAPAALNASGGNYIYLAIA